ncbi:hypothetical protein GOBAR_AA14269 [Gossypium barbadense]|uniref:Uncharacterized protein n=1 Tax=Gossypium barbadense TaxID=3634 RepID=A0A2P5XST1_GOSBA|nr:hypothetical protein GOBAR_AA14269 [Gossypium barbadense]
MEEEHTQNINPSTLASRRNKSNIWLNAITIQDEKGLVEPEPEPRQGIMVSKSKGEVDHSEQTPETLSKNTPEPCSSNDKEPIYEERRLQVEELDEWWIQKSRSHDKPKPRHDELNISPNQLKVGEKVLLHAADPRIATSEPNGEIPLTILSIFPYGTVEAIHPKFSTFMVFQNNTARHTACLRPRPYHGRQHDRVIRPCENRYHVKSTWQENHRPCLVEEEKISIIIGSYCGNQVSIPLVSLGTTRGTFLDTMGPTPKAIYGGVHGQQQTRHPPSPYPLFSFKVLECFMPDSANYDPNRSKVSTLARSLRYLHAILAHTLTRRRESTGIVNTYDTYFLWSMANRHVFDLAYFIALTIRYLSERYRKGVISIGPYMTRLAQYFGLLNMAAQASSLTLIGQMSPQGISKDITDDVPPRHEDPLSQPPPIHYPIHAAASYSDISDYKELQSSPSLRHLKLHWKRFSTTAMSCPTTAITSSLDTVVVEPNLYHHRSILLQSYHCLGRLFSIPPIHGFNSTFRKFHFSLSLF